MNFQGAKKRVILMACVLIILALTQRSRADFDISVFIDNFENNDKQTVLAGPIDLLVLERGPARFELRSGNLTLADFGCKLPLAMVFQGRVNFTYRPPDAIECYQLHKFTGQDTLICEFDDITFFWTVPPEGLPDSSLLTRQAIEKAAWKKIKDAQKDALDYMGIYLPNALAGDLVSASQDTFFYADFAIKKFEQLVFRDNQLKDDRYSLCKLRQTSGHKTYDVYGAFSPDGTSLLSARGLLPIDITHYNLNVYIENNFDLQIESQMYFVPLRNDRKYIHFDWYYDTVPISMSDANNEPIRWLKHKDENGLGLALNQPMVVGETTFVNLTYECRGLRTCGECFFLTASIRGIQPTDTTIGPRSMSPSIAAKTMKLSAAASRSKLMRPTAD